MSREQKPEWSRRKQSVTKKWVTSGIGHLLCHKFSCCTYISALSRDPLLNERGMSSNLIRRSAHLQFMARCRMYHYRALWRIAPELSSVEGNIIIITCRISCRGTQESSYDLAGHQNFLTWQVRKAPIPVSQFKFILIYFSIFSIIYDRLIYTHGFLFTPSFFVSLFLCHL